MERNAGHSPRSEAEGEAMREPPSAEPTQYVEEDAHEELDDD
jgi:hypothetical protein